MKGKTPEELETMSHLIFPNNEHGMHTTATDNLNQGLRRRYWINGYIAAQSSMESEIDRRANEKVDEWKKGVIKKIYADKNFLRDCDFSREMVIDLLKSEGENQ
jgi:hypothetical protein